MSEIKSKRRFYLLKRLYARTIEDDNDGVWRSKQESIPGTDLASDFPLRERLADSGYTTVEDLDGADETELGTSGFSMNEAQRILAALNA